MPMVPVRILILAAVFAFAVASIAVARQNGPLTLDNLSNPTPLDPAESSDRNLDAGSGQDPGQRPVATFPGPRPASAAEPRRPAVPAVAADRLPVPEESAVDEAIDLIRQAYDDSLRAAQTDPEPVIRKFRETADQTADPSRKYALLMLAEQLALEAEATSRALEVLAKRATIFKIDLLAARNAMLQGIAQQEGGMLDEAFFGHVVDTANAAADADRYDLADAAADLAVATAKAIDKDERARAVDSRKRREQPAAAIAPELLLEAGTLQKAVRDRRRQAFAYTVARDKLADHPDDAEAAETVGRHLCFVKDDWKQGLAALAKGRNEELRNLAVREIAAVTDPKAKPTTLLKLANDWWKLAERGDELSPVEVEALQGHAAGIYARISSRLEDPIDIALARKRSKATAPEPVREPVPAPTPASTPAVGPARLTLDAVHESVR